MRPKGGSILNPRLLHWLLRLLLLGDMSWWRSIRTMRASLAKAARVLAHIGRNLSWSPRPGLVGSLTQRRSSPLNSVRSIHGRVLHMTGMRIILAHVPADIVVLARRKVLSTGSN